MMQQNAIEKMASGREAFGFSFKWWLFIFVTVLLPLDLIYRAGALWLALPWYQIGIDFASLGVFFALMALFIAFISLVGSLLLQLITRQGMLIIKALNEVIGLFILMITIAYYFYEWVSRVSYSMAKIDRNLKYSILYICVGLFILFIFYYKLSLNHKITKTIHKFYMINIMTILICLFVTAFVVVDNLYDGYRATIVSQTVKKKVSIPDRVNIILITFDALSAKHTSLHGFIRDTTPELNKLGRESYVFNNMYSSCNWTLPSLSSLLTGKQPTNHQMKNDYSFFIGNSQNENLLQILKEAEYNTAVSVANPFFIPWKINFKGVDHAYTWITGYKSVNNLIEYSFESGIRSGGWLLSLIRRSLLFRLMDRLLGWDHEPVYVTPEQTFAQATKFLSHTQPPVFLWIHVWPPHSPYVPGEKFLYTFLPERIFDSFSNFKRDVGGFGLSFQSADQPKVDKLSLRYDENILYADHELGKFLSFLRQTGVYDQSIIIVSSDHGESFERNFWSHGGPYLYQCLIHVPLVIHLPGQTQGKRIEANVSHVDLAPTILDFLGIKAPLWMDGKSFEKALHDPRFDTGTKFSMNLYQINPDPNLKTTSIAAIQGDYKLIKYLKFNQYEMYDLRKDPNEKDNLVGQATERFLSLKKEIDEFLAPKTPQ